MKTPAIEIENLGCSLNGNRILRDVDLSVGRGEYLSLIGPNGAGKTTLLRCVTGLLGTWTGSIQIGGEPTRDMKRKRLAAIAGFVPQADSRHVPFTVEEFVLMGRYPHLSPFTAVGHGDRAAVSDALEKTGTSRLAGRRVDSLSGGERQMVMIAAVLAQGASILLLDEPTTFLDPRHQASVNDLLRRLHRDEGKTIVTVTHDINAAALLGDRAAILVEGRIVHDGPSGSVMSNDILEPAYGTRFIFAAHPQTGRPVIVPRKDGR